MYSLSFKTWIMPTPATVTWNVMHIFECSFSDSHDTLMAKIMKAFYDTELWSRRVFVVHAECKVTMLLTTVKVTHDSCSTWYMTGRWENTDPRSNVKQSIEAIPESREGCDKWGILEIEAEGVLQKIQFLCK